MLKRHAERMLAAFVIAAALLFAPPANAACPRHFHGGVEPQATNGAFAARTHDLCFEAFAVWASGETRTPLWSAEHLTYASISAARQLPRHDDFHAERSLPRADRAELSDYVHSGFDRGHLAPSGDMPSPRAQQESFSLANIVPQNAALNRGLWEELESATRSLALRDGDVFVVTGPIFAHAPPALHGRVLTPRALFKAVYDVRRNLAVAYVAANAQPSSYRVISITELREHTGIDVFPTLSESVKNGVVDLLDLHRVYRGEQVAEAAPPTRAPRRGVILEMSEVADRSPRFPARN